MSVVTSHRVEVVGGSTVRVGPKVRLRIGGANGMSVRDVTPISHTDGRVERGEVRVSGELDLSDVALAVGAGVHDFSRCHIRITLCEPTKI